MAEIVMIDGGFKCTGCLQEHKLDFPMDIDKLKEVMENITKQHEHCKKQLKMFDIAHLYETEFDFLVRLLSEDVTERQERLILERIQILKHKS